MGINVSEEFKYIIDRCREIAEREDVTPATKIDALKLIEHAVEAVVGINIQAQRMKDIQGMFEGEEE